MVSPSSCRLLLPGLLVSGTLLLLGCGGSGGGASTPAPPPAGNPTATQVNFGDAPADWLMAFGMTVDSVVMTTSAGATTSLVATPTPMEMTRTMGTMQPVVVQAVPQGTYTQAVVTFGSVTMGYLDPISHAYTQKTLPGPFTATVPFSPSLTVGSTPMALDFDMDMASSVAIDGSGNVTLTPVMTASAATVPASGASTWSGAMEHQVGRVSAVSGSSFTMGSMMGLQTATFATDGGTRFTGTGLSAMAGMGAGMIVAVDASLQADGSLLARRVEAMGAGTAGMMGGGLVNAITGNPPTQFTLAANGGMGGGMMASSMAGTLTVSVGALTPYAYDADGIDLAGLPFTPAFGPGNLAKGQQVEVVSTSGMMGGGMMGGTGTLAASQVRLEPQGLHGSVSAYAASGSQAGFTLTLPTDSAFATLTGATSVQVFQQAGTRLQGLASVANGADVEARGLLFLDGGVYKLVAGTLAPGAAVTVNPPPAAGSTPVQVALGDGPSDWITAFAMTVNSVMLAPASGSPVNAMPAAAAMEMTQALGTMQPVAVQAVPQGTYTQATVTISSVAMAYLDPASHTMVRTSLAGPYTATVPLSPGLTVGAGPMALDFDMDLASSVAIDGSGNVTLAPVMTARMATVPASGQTPWSGAMMHQVGSVSSVSGSGFTMGSMMGMQTAAFTTGGGTRFTGGGLAGMTDLANGMMVAVDAALQADGSWLAQRVAAMGVDASGMMGGGLVTSITGNPPTQLTLLANGGMGGGMMASSMGGTLTVSLPAAVPYSYDADGVDLANLPFTPAFGPATLAEGQRVEVVSTGGMMGGGMMGGSGALSAAQVRLEQQGLHGTVSGATTSGSQATFTLALPSGSAFATLTGASSVQVYQQAGTQLFNLASVADGADLDVRGLLFYDGTAYRMVASWLVAH